MTTTSSSVIPRLTDWHGAARSHPYFICDVFTSEPLQGNQLGVFVDGRPFTTDEMQSLARELNVAETVFLLPPREGGDVRVRIFTTESELPFAGIAVLGGALVSGAALAKDAVALETGAGLVPVRLEANFGWMHQPIPVWEPFERTPELLAVLGVTASRLPVDVYRNGPQHVFVALESEAEVAALRPDLAALEELGVGANCFAGSGLAWKTRMFYPAIGIAEDPATGSAAGPLAVHLARHGQIAFGQEIEIRQGAEIGRPSVLYARATGSAERIESVEVGGGALIVAEGVFRIARS